MEHLVKEVFTKGILDARGQCEELNKFMSMIQRFAEILAQSSDAAQVCSCFVKIIIEETSFENCSILFWDSPRNRLSLVAAYGLEDQLETRTRRRYRQNLRFTFGEGISGQAFSSRRPIFIENTAKEPIPELKDAAVAPVSLACIPIMHLGVLNVSALHSQEFTPQTRRNWEMLGNIIGYFIIGLNSAREAGRDEVSPDSRGADRATSSCASSRGPTLSDTILDSIPQGVCILDTEGRVIRFNRSVEKLQGENFPEIISRSPAVLFQDPNIFDKLLARLAESGSGQVEKTDVNLMNSSGDTYLADINLVKILDSAGFSGYLLVIDDVTRKKAFSEKIIQSEKLAALGTMAGGVSHDFNNLLMAILGHIQLVLPQVQDEEIRRRLQNIEKAVYDGSNTVRRLQRFTEREREPKAAASSVDVNEAIKDVIELTRPRWKNFMERSGFKIDLQLDLEENCLAAINASDLREVITNLLLNAIDAMPQGGTLTFRTICKGETVGIEISDTGIGMSKDIAEKIFDPFFTTKGIGNSGLGLSVSWSLLGRYGGDIQVRSKPGKGTTFVLKLTRAEAVKNQAGLKSAEGSSSYRLLLVEDDPEILNILRDMLRLKGHRVVALSDGAKALELIETSHFDLVLTDLGMPVISGWEIAKRVKAKNENTPVVMITGWGAQYEEENLASRGVDLMLAKPLSWEKLLSSIEKML
ncbi:MAG: ATP-binding protein [Syntrophobacteraceae bacterium]